MPIITRTLALVFIVFAMLLSSACTPKRTQLTEAENGQTVEVNAGEQFSVTLEANPSTGYTWEAKDLDATQLEQVGEPGFKGSNPGLIGSGGRLTLTFKALQAGTTTLTLVYHRPWETDVEPASTYIVTLVVK
jgi:inhibitor of cysteine peptidase